MKPIPLLHTVPIVLVGVKRSDSKDKLANYTTIGDVAIAGLNPALMMISLHEDHFTTQCIKREGVLSINVPSRDMLKKVDYCGRVSGFEVDKSKLFVSRWMNETPYLKVAPIKMICEVEKSVHIERRVIFILRVIKTMKRGSIVLNDLKSIQYGLDNNYYETGRVIGKGYEESLDLLIE